MVGRGIVENVRFELWSVNNPKQRVYMCRWFNWCLCLYAAFSSDHWRRILNHELKPILRREHDPGFRRRAITSTTTVL